MNFEFYVITKVPDILEYGNMADELMYEGCDSDGDKIICVGITNKNKQSIGQCNVPVFEEGEIIICDVVTGLGTGELREVCYPGRNDAPVRRGIHPCPGSAAD